tara:strand:+ start:347 stop:1198 length:852 start_codon:yes stop_codon:yes gene_type:complete
MANLKDIRDRIKSIKSIQQVTGAMKMVAAAKMRKAQERMEQARPYSRRLSDLIKELIPDVDRSILPLLENREKSKHTYVIITSDRGLAGSFNTNVLKKAQKEIDLIGKEDVDLICIGKKARDHFKARNYNIISEHLDFWNELNFDHAVGYGKEIIEQFVSGKTDHIQVVYNEFVSVATQQVISEQLLPLEYGEGDTVSEDKIYEPTKDDIVLSLIPKHLNVQVWKYLLESYASEQAARMLAMENATTNAQDMIRDLTLEFNKARQTAITMEILDIVGGAEALK